MTVSNQNPIEGSLLTPADSISFTLTPVGAITFFQVTYLGTATEVVLLSNTFQPGFSGEQVFPPGGGDDREVSFVRTAGYDASPFSIKVDWVDDNGGNVATWSYELATEAIYPSLMQPRNPESQGTLTVTEDDVPVGKDIGWIDFKGADFDLDNLGNGKMRVNANASLKGGGGGAGAVGIGKWKIANVAGSGTPAAGELILNSADNTAVTVMLVSTTTEDGQIYDEWMQALDGLSAGWTFTVYLASDPTQWFSSPVSTFATGTVDYRNVGVNDADKANSGAATWAVDDEVYIEILPPLPDVTALSEPSTFGIGSFTYDNTLTELPALTTAAFRLDNVRPSSATVMWLYYSPRQGYELTSILDAIQGSKLTVHAQTLTNGNFQATCGTPVDKGNYYEIPLSGITDSGVDLVDGHRYGATVVTAGGASGGAVNGFVDLDDVDISIDEGTRTLTLTGTFDIYSHGILYTKTNPSVVWTDVYSPFFFYFDASGTLTIASAVTPDSFTTNCYVGYLWWHQVDNETAGGFYNMMKHAETPAREFFQECFVRGLEYNYGFQPDLSAAADSAGSLDTHIEARIFNGQTILGGTRHEHATRLGTDNLIKIRRNGSDSGGFYAQEGETNSYLVATTGTGRAGFCSPGSSHSFQEVTDGYYVWAHMCAATGDNYDEGKYISYIGLGEYANKKDAEDALMWELNTLRIFPDNGQAGMQALFRPLFSFLVQTDNSYTNTANSRVVTLTTGAEFADVRRSYLPLGNQARLNSEIGLPRTLGYAMNDRYVPTVTASDPGVGDDVDDGYFPGAIWVNSSTGDCWICISEASGAADWRQIAT